MYFVYRESSDENPKFNPKLPERKTKRSSLSIPFSFNAFLVQKIKFHCKKNSPLTWGIQNAKLTTQAAYTITFDLLEVHEQYVNG